LQLATSGKTSRATSKRDALHPTRRRAAHGLAEADIVNRRFDRRYVNLMKDLIARTRTLFAEGAPLAKMVGLSTQHRSRYVQSRGLAVLDAIEASGYDTLHASSA